MRRLCLMLACLALLSNAAAEEEPEFPDYCKVDCGKYTHTSCTYKTDKPGKKCRKYKDRLFTQQQKQEILDKHNELREQTAQGKTPGQPGASNMYKLVWSLELEQIARRWAFQCNFNHDKCRHTKDGKHAGQNLHIGTERGDDYFKKQVQDWHDEYKLYKATGDGPFSFNSATGHYTQLVWAKTMYLGCERTQYNGQDYVVCSYSPGGNVMGEPVYKTGSGGLIQASPREGESGKPEATVLKTSGGMTIGPLQCLALLPVCLVISLKSAILVLGM